MWSVKGRCGVDNMQVVVEEEEHKEEKQNTQVGELMGGWGRTTEIKRSKDRKQWKNGGSGSGWKLR